MKKKHHVKANDLVVVISGEHKTEEPHKVLKVYSKDDRVLIEGVNMVKKWEKSRDNPEPQEIEREYPIHISNVMKADKFAARRARKGGDAPAEPVAAEATTE